MRTTILVAPALTAVALMAAGAARSTPREAPLPASAGQVMALAFDPASPKVVYAVTEPGPGGSHDRVYKSTDGGNRWERLRSGQGWFRTYALAVDPRHPNTVYVGGGRAVYKTTDGGRSWHAFSRGLLPPPGINRGEGWVGWLAFDPADRALYEFDYSSTLRKSVDGGHTWNVVLSGFKRFGVWGPIMAPRPASALYAAFTPIGPRGGPPGVYKSTDGGKFWRRLGLPAPDSSGAILSAADPQRQTLYFATQDRLFASADAGQSWHLISQGLPREQPLTALAAGGGNIIVSLGKDGVYTSRNEGQTWTRSWPASGITPGLGVGLITSDPAHPSTVLAAEGYSSRQPENQILRSTDGGRTWTVPQ